MWYLGGLMSKTVCETCQKPIANLACGLCQAAVCKHCAHVLEENQFDFLPQVPAEMTKEIYCNICFNATVAPFESEYQDTMERAKDINVFMKAQSKETRLVRRHIPPVKVQDCPDEQEAIMRLAFLAARAGCNAIIDVDLRHEKVHLSGYQTTKWKGTAVPARVDARILGDDRRTLGNPN